MSDWNGWMNVKNEVVSMLSQVFFFNIDSCTDSSDCADWLLQIHFAAGWESPGSYRCPKAVGTSLVPWRASVYTKGPDRNKFSLRFRMHQNCHQAFAHLKNRADNTEEAPGVIICQQVGSPLQIECGKYDSFRNSAKNCNLCVCFSFLSKPLRATNSNSTYTSMVLHSPHLPFAGTFGCVKC